MSIRPVLFFAALAAVHLTAPTAFAQDNPHDASSAPDSGSDGAHSEPAPTSPVAPAGVGPAPRPVAVSGPDVGPGSADESVSTPSPAPRPYYYSPGAAAGFAALATGASFGLIFLAGTQQSTGLVGLGFVALTIAPSAGHFYTRDRRGWITLGLRSLSFLMLLAGAGGDADALGAVGAFAYFGVGLYSLIDAPFSAARANRRERRRARQLTFMPTVIPINGQRSTMGLGLSGSF